MKKNASNVNGDILFIYFKSIIIAFNVRKIKKNLHFLMGKK